MVVVVVVMICDATIHKEVGQNYGLYGVKSNDQIFDRNTVQL